MRESFAKRRMNPRYAFFADAEITLRNGASLSAQLSELSSRGCYIDALESVPVGTEFNLRIRDGVSTCEVPGKVIYKHTGGGLGVVGMGVVFGQIAPEQTSLINGWLRSLSGAGVQGETLAAVQPQVGSERK